MSFRGNISGGPTSDTTKKGEYLPSLTMLSELVIGTSRKGPTDELRARPSMAYATISRTLAVPSVPVVLSQT
jgi:hypothetical protein